MLDLHDRFAPFFPIGDGLATLEVVPLEPYGDAGGEQSEAAIVVIRLIIFEERDGQRMVRDIKEQQVRGGPASLYDDPARVDEMLYAQQEVLGEVLRGPIERVEGLMPGDLLFTNVLSLVKARSREHFAKALRAKSRLGRLLSR